MCNKNTYKVADFDQCIELGRFRHFTSEEDPASSIFPLFVRLFVFVTETTLLITLPYKEIDRKILVFTDSPKQFIED